MNHDPTPTSPADPNQPNASHRRRSPNHGDIDGDGLPDTAPNEGSASGAQGPRSDLSQRAKEGLQKKLQFVNHLLLTLDTLIYAELCILYYMDCSFFRLVIRWFPHWLFLGVKPDNILIAFPNYLVGAIFGSNFACMFFHLVFALPTATEASRGYLHGGVLIDFVGQKAPTSKLSLMLLDVLVLGLQCFMLAVNMQKDQLKKIIRGPQATGSSGTSGAENIPTNNDQDLDAEERGVLRNAPVDGADDDIELQPLRNGDAQDEERPANSSEEPSRRNRRYEELNDLLSSGNAVLADFDVRGALRTAWTDNRNTSEAAAAYALQNVGYNATLAALAAQRRTRLFEGRTGAQGV